MHFKTLVRSALACTVITLASACGSSDSTGPDYDPGVTTANTEDAAELGYQVLNQMMSGIYNMGISGSPAAVKAELLAGAASLPPIMAAPVSRGYWARSLDAGRQIATLFPTAGLQRSASPGCTYTESGASGPGEPLDANGNGFPDDWHLLVVCVTTEEGDGDTVYTTREVQDILVRERPQDLVGFEIRAVMSGRGGDNHGNFEEQELRQELLLSVNSGHATHHLLTRMTERAHFPGDTETSTLEQMAGGDAGYDPFFPIVLGNPLPDGHLTLGAEVHLINTEDGLAYRFVLDTPEPLEFDRSCAENSPQPWVAGILRGRLNGNGHIGFRITFHECGTDPDFETFGTDDAVPVAPKFIAPRFHP